MADRIDELLAFDEAQAETQELRAETKFLSSFEEEIAQALKASPIPLTALELRRNLGIRMNHNSFGAMLRGNPCFRALDNGKWCLQDAGTEATERFVRLLGKEKAHVTQVNKDPAKTSFTAGSARPALP